MMGEFRWISDRNENAIGKFLLGAKFPLWIMFYIYLLKLNELKKLRKGILKYVYTRTRWIDIINKNIDLLSFVFVFVHEAENVDHTDELSVTVLHISIIVTI